MPRRKPGAAPRIGAHKPAERSIKKSALALLQIVDHFESKADDRPPRSRIEVADATALNRSTIRSVGLDYGEVMRRLKADFPDATTSIACLRWYCVKAREGMFGEAIVLPQRRPRTKPE
jgi:hypothetical protein